MRAWSFLRQAVAALLCVLLAAPASSASTSLPAPHWRNHDSTLAGVYPKTRVWVFEVTILHHIRAIDELSRELHRGCEQASETIAVGSGVRYDYDAFGNLVNQTGTTPNNYLFAGEQFDPALNLYYNRARYLNTATGRFWSMDTYKGDKWRPTTLHRYSYSWNNPANVVDPSGLDGDLGSLAVEESVNVVEDTMPVVQTAPIIEAFEEPEIVAEAPQVASGFQKAVAWLLIGTAALGTAAGVGGTGNQVPIDQEVAEASQNNYDIYRFGNTTKLADLRPGDYALNARGWVAPQDPIANPNSYLGASAFRNPWKSGLTGIVWRTSVQSVYDANGLAVIADTAKNIPAEAGHHTIYATEEMTLQDYDQRIRSLGWIMVPKRIR